MSKFAITILEKNKVELKSEVIRLTELLTNNRKEQKHLEKQIILCIANVTLMEEAIETLEKENHELKRKNKKTK